MKIYRVRPIANDEGDFVSKMIVQPATTKNWFNESWAAIDSVRPLAMRWNPGELASVVSDMVPTTAPGILLGHRAAAAMRDYLALSIHYLVILDDGSVFVGFAPLNYKKGQMQVGHLLSAYPEHGYTMVSEAFKRAWEDNGFTGMTFEAVGEIDDAAFVPVP